MKSFSAKELRPRLAALLGLKADPLSAGRVTCDLRRLRLHGLLAPLADPACESPPLRRKFDALADAINQAGAAAQLAA